MSRVKIILSMEPGIIVKVPALPRIMDNMIIIGAVKIPATKILMIIIIAPQMIAEIRLPQMTGNIQEIILSSGILIM